MLSCRIGISLVTGIEFPESLLLPISGVSREGVLEWPAELGECDDPDSLESRPPAMASSCSFILKDGIGYWPASGIGLRRRESRERLEWFALGGSAVSSGGIGGSALLGAVDIASAIALALPLSSLVRVGLDIPRVL